MININNITMLDGSSLVEKVSKGMCVFFNCCSSEKRSVKSGLEHQTKNPLNEDEGREKGHGRGQK